MRTAPTKAEGPRSGLSPRVFIAPRCVCPRIGPPFCILVHCWSFQRHNDSRWPRLTRWPRCKQRRFSWDAPVQLRKLALIGELYLNPQTCKSETQASTNSTKRRWAFHVFTNNRNMESGIWVMALRLCLDKCWASRVSVKNKFDGFIGALNLCGDIFCQAPTR